MFQSQCGGQLCLPRAIRQASRESRALCSGIRGTPLIAPVTRQGCNFTNNNLIGSFEIIHTVAVVNIACRMVCYRLKSCAFNLPCIMLTKYGHCKKGNRLLPELTRHYADIN